MAPGAHTRNETLENALRDDLAAARRALYSKDKQIEALKRQLVQTKSELQQARRQSSGLGRVCRQLRSGLRRLARVLCPCCAREITQRLLSEHVMEQSHRGGGINFTTPSGRIDSHSNADATSIESAPPEEHDALDAVSRRPTEAG